MARKAYLVTLTRLVTETGQYVCFADSKEDVENIVKQDPAKAGQLARWNDGIDPIIEDGIKLEDVEEFSLSTGWRVH